jgi:hypothetical protein
MTKLFNLVFLAAVFQIATVAQTIRVNPTGVNVNSQNPTSVFLTFGQIPTGYVPAEAIWCGELIPAQSPALGLQCRPDTIYGALPARYDRSTASGSGGGLTDIMAIPPSVVRRAYQAAVAGESAGFFYVRRFVSTVAGRPDQFVHVTCRMTGGGARVPFALTNVEIKTLSGEPVLFVRAGEKLPEIFAEIQYNGTGRLKGRWEIVQPGEKSPDERDLLTEAALPIEQRGAQRRYTQISRFNYFLPPSAGKFKLPLQLKEKSLDFTTAGQYILLLRIEASDDKESDSNLSAVGVGNGIVHSGALASFPLPTLKFFVVGRGESGGEKFNGVLEAMTLVSPSENAALDFNQPLIFKWKHLPGAAAYRLEILDENENSVLAAVTLAPDSVYRAPSWFWSHFGAKKLAWRVAALDADGKVINQSRAQKLLVTK